MSSPRVAAGPGESGGGRLAHLKARVKHVARVTIEPWVRRLAGLGVRAGHVTVLGALASLGAAVFFFEGRFVWGAALLTLSGVCDVLDGELARERQEVSRFGAFLDSTLDRVGEAAVLAGIAGFYLSNLTQLAYEPERVLSEMDRGLEPRTWAVVTFTAVLALVGSLLVSYTRARAEGLGLECKVGWFERSERLPLLIVAGAFGVGPVMPGALLVLAVMSFVTATQRVIYVWKITRTR